MRKINDPTYDFVRSIYMKNVPLQSELSNPFAANKRQKKNPLWTELKRALYMVSHVKY